MLHILVSVVVNTGSSNPACRLSELLVVEAIAVRFKTQKSSG